MSAFDRVRRWFHRESAEVKDAWEGMRDRADADLTRREAELSETPEEGLRRLQEEGRQNDEAFEELRRRISGSAAEPSEGGPIDAKPPTAKSDPLHPDRPDRSD